MPHANRDITTLRACRRGNEAAARSFYARHAPALTLYARSILRDEALSEDAVHSALCRMFTTPLAIIDAVDDPHAWLVRLVRNEALNTLRARRRAIARERSAGANGAAAINMHQSSPQTGADPDLARAIESLPRRLRETIVLKHVAQLTFDQMALALGANRHTIAARHRAAMARLRESLAVSDETAVKGAAHA